MLASLRCSGPLALRAARAARPAVGRLPVRCMASKGGRKKDAEESEWQMADGWASSAGCWLHAC